MSVSYWGKVIVGCPLKDLYRYEIKDDEETRYHVKTGQPYTIKVKKLFATFGTKELPSVEQKGNGANYWQDYSFLKVEVFIPFDGAGDPKHCFDHGIVGIEVLSGDRDNELVGISMPVIKNAMDKVKDVLKEYGWEGLPKVYCQLDGG